MSEKKKKSFEQDITGDGINSIKKVVETHNAASDGAIKYVLIGVCVVFLFVMLVLPLAVVAVNALKEGWLSLIHI